MRIIVKSKNLRLEKTSKGTELRKQAAAVEGSGDFPLAFELTVQEPYPPGVYELDGASFRVGRFGGLELDPYRISLVPVKG